MKSSNCILRFGLVCAASLLLNGCFLKPVTVSTRHFVLVPIPASERPADATARLSVGVGSVKMPEYLLSHYGLGIRHYPRVAGRRSIDWLGGVQSVVVHGQGVFADGLIDLDKSMIDSNVLPGVTDVTLHRRGNDGVNADHGG